MRIPIRPQIAIILTLALAATTAACSSATGGIKTSGAWARQSMAMADTGAAYLVIENTGSAADYLVGGSTPAATTVEVHETKEMGSAIPAESAAEGMASASPDAMSGSGMLGMQKIDRLEIPAGGSVELKPGSYHLMLIGLTQELTVGDTIEMTLDFEKAGAVKVTAEVREG
jgi:copper(I)-binding protein